MEKRIKPTVLSDRVKLQLQQISNDTEDQCLLCTDSLKIIGFGKCNHKEVCANCVLRRRLLYGNTECLYCKEPLSSIIICNKDAPSMDFNSQDLKGFKKASTNLPTFANLNSIYLSEPTRIWFEQYCKAFDFKCPSCDILMDSLKDLKSHLSKSHNQKFCPLCLESRKVFLQEQKLYDAKSLKKHFASGDADTLIKHELCKFCNKNFYDNDALHVHYQNDHEHCKLCIRQGNNQYYNGYKELEIHYREKHFPCMESSCKEKKYVVFGSATELQLHQYDHVKQNSNSKKEIKSAAHLKCDFKTAKQKAKPEVEPVVKSEAPKNLTGKDFPTLGPAGSEQPKEEKVEKAEDVIRKKKSAWSQPFRSQLDINFPALSNSNLTRKETNSISSAWKKLR